MDLHSTATESLVSGGLAMALTYINRKIIHLLTFYKKKLVSASPRGQGVIYILNLFIYILGAAPLASRRIYIRRDMGGQKIAYNHLWTFKKPPCKGKPYRFSG